MRRISCALAAAVLGCLAMAGTAAAKGEISDPCGSDVSLPGIVNGDPTAPWLDICSGDVGGARGDGPLRAVHAVLHLNGDTADRQGYTAYTLDFTVPNCTGLVAVEDRGRASDPGVVRVAGVCDPNTTCPLPIWTSCTSGGRQFNVSAGTAKLTGSTVTLDFDPNKLSTHSVPKSFFTGLAAGSLTSVGARTGPVFQNDAFGADAFYGYPTDQANGTKPVSLKR
jgi:hypothetical protein